MGKIKKILENELVGGTQTTDVYPVTSTKAVYDENNKRLDEILSASDEKLTELKVEFTEAFTKNDFSGILDKIEVTEDHTVFKTPYTLLPNIDYKIVNNIGIDTKFNALTEDGLQVTLATIRDGKSAVFQVPSKCKYITFFAAIGTKGKYFEIGEGVDYRKKILNSEIEINECKSESDFNGLKQGIIGENLEKPIFVLKHINEAGGNMDNNNKSITFKDPIYAAKGSSFYVKTGYKMQYALYDKITLSFIKRVVWIPANQIVQLDDDYFIRIELANTLESELTDTSISENLQMTLYNKAESIDARIKNISTQQIDISKFIKRKGIIAYGKWLIGDDHKHIMIPVYPNQLYKIEAGEAKSSYCFLKNYQTPVNGETPNYSEGYTGNIDIEPYATAYVTAPKDAYCMIVAAEISGVNRLPTAIYSYGEIDSKIEDSISSLFSSSIELSSYPAKNGIIANGVWRAIDTSYQHIVIPVNGGDIYVITANDTGNTSYCLLKGYITPIANKKPIYATGYTEEINITKGTSVDVAISEDAKYMCLTVKVGDTDRTPSSLVRKGPLNNVIDNETGKLSNKIDNEIDNIEFEIEDSFYQLSQQGDNLISILGEESIVGKKITIAHPDKYTCWPFLCKVNNRLVCLYTKTDKHEGTNIGAVYVRLSANGLVWTPKQMLVDTKNVRDNVTGTGNDDDGNLLFWNRVGFTDSTTYYEVYKSSDGIRYDIFSKPIFDEVVQPTNIINIPTKGLMSFYHVYGTERKWGIITSPDNGVTWNKKELGRGTPSECPTEIYGVYIGEGRILAIGRYDAYTGNQALWQIQSSDYGETWSIVPTNLVFGGGNTPSLLYDESTNNLDLFVYQRSSGKLFHMQNSVDSVWDNPTNWASGVVIGNGTIGQDAGNVNSVVFNRRQIISYYSGSSTETGIYAVIL